MRIFVQARRWLAIIARTEAHEWAHSGQPAWTRKVPAHALVNFIIGWLLVILMVNLLIYLYFQTRLAQLWLEVNKLAQSGKLSGCLFTRAFGHAILKGTFLSLPPPRLDCCRPAQICSRALLALVAEYKDNDQLRAAHSSPLIADPDIVGPIELPFAVDADPADYNPGMHVLTNTYWIYWNKTICATLVLWQYWPSKILGLAVD